MTQDDIVGTSHENVLAVLDVLVAVVVAQLRAAGDLRHRVEHNPAAAVVIAHHCNRKKELSEPPVKIKLRGVRGCHTAHYDGHHPKGDGF